MHLGPTFYTPATVYWNGLTGGSTPTAIPWIQSFSDMRDISIAVLSNDLGSSVAGLYVRIVDPVTGRPTWKLAMPMAALSAAMATNSTLQIIVNSAAITTFAAPNVLYANGQVVAGGATAVTSTLVYLVATPPMVAGGTFTVATLPLAATAGSGARSFVTDANAATFKTALVGGGANKVPVFSDGTGWFIG